MKKKKKTFPYKLVGGITGLTLAILGLFAFGGYVHQLPEEVFVERTMIRGFNDEAPELVGSFSTFAELETATEAWLNLRLAQPLQLQSERGTYDVTLSTLGVSPDWVAVRPQLGDYMNSANIFEKINAFLFGNTVEIGIVLDETRFGQTLTETGFEQSDKNAIFLWDGTAVVIQPGQIGYTIQKEELRTFLQSSFTETTFPESFTLSLLASEPEVTDAELTALLSTAEELATKTVTFQDEFGNTWDLELRAHLDWVLPGEPWTLDEAAFVSYAETTLVPEVEEDPTGVVITQNEDGSITFEGSARFGKELDKLGLLALVLERLQNPPELPESEIVYADEPLALPIEKVMPAVTVPDALKEKGITDLVGLGYSDFGGSPTNRIHNINTGIAQFNGVIIEQGEEFSFMNHMSPVDAEHGFRTELVIKGDETIPEYGGGLCQISSTMFRAALYSGLPITARRNHSYAVSYYARPYGYGLDATVYDPAPDLKFMNDTPGALLVQAYTDGDSAYYVFYGTNDARTVTMEGPYAYDYKSIPSSVITYTDKLEPGVKELKEYGHTGFTVDWYRVVTYVTPTAEELAADPTLYVSPYAATVSGVKEQIHSVYQARPAKYWEGQAAENTPEVATE